MLKIFLGWGHPRKLNARIFFATNYYVHGMFLCVRILHAAVCSRSSALELATLLTGIIHLGPDGTATLHNLDQKALLNPEVHYHQYHRTATAYLSLALVGSLSPALKYLSRRSHPDSFVYMIATNAHLSCIFHHFMIHYLTGGSAAAWHNHGAKYDPYLIFVGGASHEN